MEQKKILWIIAATGVFLLVVIGAAIILYSPSNYPAPAVASLHVPVQSAPAPGIQPQTQGQTPTDSPSTEFAPRNTYPEAPNGQLQGQDRLQQIGELTVISGTTNVYGVNAPDRTTTIDLNTLKNMDEKSGYTMQTAPETTAEPVADPNKTVSKAADNADNVKTQKPAAGTKTSVKPATAKTGSASSTAAGKAKPVTKPAAKATSPAPKYWVQAAAFSAKKSADNAREILSENKIPAEIFTYTDSKKQVVYRVRIGPYTTKSEAEYWKNKIVQIEQFKDSKAYITDSSAAK
ncbi:SPOR domain-containing protein [Treponema parvum]|uniref:SPOR domain-containing protein n=1 Tax=Treponema parvum TaxID=138851 RepID=A0A975F184_9SPIR|nr:SPOR domain-containing protein [Treponema parvum]QTQ12219.1 SPOR domain-containing protein [Treponema parvum]